jgi:hypothetical protein
MSAPVRDTDTNINQQKGTEVYVTTGKPKKQSKAEQTTPQFNYIFIERFPATDEHHEFNKI